ncbi:MAG: 5' nucleotidase, NT5C type [Candidatus Paceibacterota bacterium]
MRKDLFTQQKQRFVLAVDLDGVCASYTESLRPYMAAMGREDAFRLPEPTSWNLVEAGWFKSMDDYMETHRYAVERAFFRTMNEIPGMSDALWILSDSEIHIRVVTHRFLTHGDQGQAAADTVAWLQSRRDDGRVRVPHRDLCFLGTKPDASADMHLDDAPFQIEGLKQAGERVLIFDQSYNRHLEGERAVGWGDVVTKVLAARDEWASGR